jgi:hypothetical protein
MEKDILLRLDEFLKDKQVVTDIIFIEKQNALLVIDKIIKEVSEDKFLLTTVKQNIEENWSRTNKKLINTFNSILEYYNIKESTNDRKTTLVLKGKTVVRKTVILEQKKQILELLNAN